MDKFLPMNSPS